MLKKKILNYTKNFTKDEKGVETIEFIGLVCIAAALIAAIILIGQKMQEYATKSMNTMESELSNAVTFGQSG